MSLDQNNRIKSNSSRKINKSKSILERFLVTVVLIVAVEIAFSFKFQNIIISALIVSVMFFALFYSNRQKKPKSGSTYNKDKDDYIKLYQPKGTRDESRLVELKRNNINFKIDYNDENTSKSAETDKKPVVSVNGRTEAEKELKRMFNPYKSPFDPINPAKNEVTIANVPSEIKDDVKKPLYDLEYNEEENIINSIEEFETETAVTSQDTYDYEEPIVSILTGDSYNVQDEDKEPENIQVFEEEVFNVVKFRPRLNDQIQHIDDLIDNSSIDNSSIVKEKFVEEPYEQPPFHILRQEKKRVQNEYQIDEQEVTSNKLIDTLASFGVGASVINVSKGPSVTRYELQPNPGVKVSKIVGLSDDIALNLAATGVRIEAPIPGKAAVGIEVPNKEITPVLFGEVIRSPEFTQHPSKLAFALGKDVAGRTIVGDVAKMPHLLIAGATGSGKSVCINTLIASILYKASPAEVKLLLVDPKVVELGVYNGIPHLLIPVVTDPKKAAGALSWAVVEMTNRYKLFAENNARDLKGYNSIMKAKNESTLPQIVIIIDELADLMMAAPHDVEDCICRLAQMARAAGMHLVIATQRPSVDVITGVIKANIPSRISFAVSSQIDSRTILDMAGAEKLLGRGDMLFNPIGEMKPTRVQGSFITDGEVEALVSFLKGKHTVTYDQDVLDKINAKEQQSAQIEINDDDELLPQVVDMVIEYGQASASLIQRKFKVGYSRAARILDQMECWGIVGQAEGSKPRQILISKSEWDELNS